MKLFNRKSKGEAAPAEIRYAIRNQADGATEIDIFGEIDSFWGYSVRQLAYDLYGRQDAPLTVRINSPGGMATEGFAIADLLRAHSGPVTTRGIGLVASIASVILLAGDRVELSENAFLMIHRPWAGMFGGDAEDLRKQADLLDKVEGQLADLYTNAISSRGRLIDDSQETTRAQVLEWMRAETWFTAAEALDNGFIDAITGAEDFAQDSEQASQQLEAVALYDHVPAQLRAHYQQKITDMAEDKATKKGLLAQLRALLVEVEEEPETATAEETPEESPAIDLDAARAALEAAGYTLTGPDDIDDEDDEEEKAVTEPDTEEADLAVLVNSLRDEIAQIRAQNRRKAGAPSGGSATAGEKKPKGNPVREKAFNAFAGTLLKYARENA